MGIIYVALVHVVLMFELQTWVMKYHIGRVLVGFHHRVSCRLTGRQPWRRRDRRWVYPPLAEAMDEAELHEV